MRTSTSPLARSIVKSSSSLVTLRLRRSITSARVGQARANVRRAMVTDRTSDGVRQRSHKRTGERRRRCPV